MDMMTRTLVVTSSRVPIVHFRPDDLVHLCRGQASPSDLGATLATHGPRELCVPDTWLRCRRGLDGLRVIDCPQRRPKRRDSHGVLGPHRIRKRGTQAIPHGPGTVIHSRSVIRCCRPLEVHRGDATVDPP